MSAMDGLSSAQLEHELLRRSIERTEAAADRALGTFNVLREKLKRQRAEYRRQQLAGLRKGAE